MTQAALDFGSRTDSRVQDMLLEAVRIAATWNDTLTVDQVWGWTPLSNWSYVHYDPRALGVAMRQAKRKGWIQATGQWRKSTSKVCHHRPVQVWRSLIHENS